MARGRRSTAQSGVVIQESASVLVQLQRGEQLAFAAPPLLRRRPRRRRHAGLGVPVLALDGGGVIDCQSVDNGPVRTICSRRRRGARGPRAIEEHHRSPSIGSTRSTKYRHSSVDELTQESVAAPPRSFVAQSATGSGRVTAPYVATQRHTRPAKCTLPDAERHDLFGQRAQPERSHGQVDLPFQASSPTRR